MPVIQLDEHAREALESYSWPGNVRQLKNVAEQISAVEQVRLISEPILRHYLPAEPVHGPVTFVAPGVGQGGQGAFGDEREILYRILFDMRSEIAEIRRTLDELRRRSDELASPPSFREVAGLLPSQATPSGFDTFDESEEIPHSGTSESADMTKDEATREAILRALKKTGGKRKEAARMLFISERTLYRKIKELGIEI